MKTCLLLPFALLLSSPLMAQGPDGLVKNHDMEEIDSTTEVPAGWDSLGGKVPLATSAVAHEGSHSLEIIAPESGNGWVRSARISVEPNTTYRVRAAFLVQLGESQQLPYYGMRIYLSDSGWTPADGEPYLLGSDDQKDDGREWKIKEATFQTGETTKWLYIGILMTGKHGGSVLLDDVLLERADLVKEE